MMQAITLLTFEGDADGLRVGLCKEENKNKARPRQSKRLELPWYHKMIEE